MNEMDKMRKIAITEYLKKCSIPFIVVNNEKASIHGCGTLIKILDNHFIISAKHVTDDIPKNAYNIGIPLNTKIGSKILLLNDTVVFSYDCAQYEIDISLIRIKSEEIVQNLKKDYSFLSYGSISLDITDDDFILYGYISSEKFTKAKDFKIHSTPFYLNTNLYPNPTTEELSKPQIENLLLYKRKGFNEEGKEIQLPNLKGISGSGVWNYKNSSSIIWNVNDALKLVGVEIAFVHSKYIKYTKINVLFDLLRKISSL